MIPWEFLEYFQNSFFMKNCKNLFTSFEFSTCIHFLCLSKNSTCALAEIALMEIQKHLENLEI